MNKSELLSKPLIYIAGPYSHENRSIQEERAERHCRSAADFRERGFCVYSPIAETCNVAKYGQIGGTWETWRTHDLRLLSACTHMWILMLPGWIESRGVRGEVKFCLNNDIPISLVDSNTNMIFQSTGPAILGMMGVKTAEELND